MPRGVHSTRVLPKLVSKPSKVTQSSPPRLWNAKRRIRGSQGLLPEQLEEFEKNPLSEEWRKYVSADVEEFVDESEASGRKLLPEDKLQLFRSPPRYFSRPHNVPNQLRKQVYFPDFTITLRRSNLGPYYAQFNVPLWFSKLDLKGYLKEIYNVDVVHIRSYVEPSKVLREDSKSMYTRGSVIRNPSEKRMTVQLVEPFTWPMKPEDLNKDPFQGKAWWKMAEAQLEESKKMYDHLGMYVDQKHRMSIAEQARKLLAGNEKWEPSWKSSPADVKAMRGSISGQQSSSVDIARR